ncbi:MAG TPA: YkvA family protein [Anaerolineae bacterium]|nr:YkvA family protein [Anaerolineae bacterium]
MAESKRDLNWFREMLNELRLAWRLLRDPLVPTWPKLVPLAALAYILFPFDFVPDVFIGLGQLDDVAVLLLGLKMFIASCPAESVRRHVAEMASVIGSYRVVPEDETRPAGTNEYVNGEHRLLEDGASRETVEDAGAGES